MNYTNILLTLLMIPGLVGMAFGHTVDSVGEYRLEIGWMNEPVVSYETNGIELFVSPLEPGLEFEKQQFKDGIAGLQKSLKMQLIFKNEKIMLPLAADHNIPGKYYAFVNPTISGYYQANILGQIGDTTVSISMHPPKVEERSYIEFPEPSDITLNQLIDGHTTLLGEINDLKESVDKLEEENQQINLSYAGIGLGIIGIAIATFALSKTKKN
ncbi:MAG: hypothetical protein OEM18_00860 [Nitrosopumilus sp.]|nr:hypothetical protein [Nitrosopumilus sp.]MDH3500970.1 hypothetical protein [Nitrosopumilus sp.]